MYWQDSTLLSLTLNATFHVCLLDVVFNLDKERLSDGGCRGEDVVSQAPTPDGRPAFG